MVLLLFTGVRGIHAPILRCGPGSQAGLTSHMGRNANLSSAWFQMSYVCGLFVVCFRLIHLILNMLCYSFC